MSSVHEESSDEESDSPSRKHKSYSAEFKLKVIQSALAGSKNLASKHYGINRRLVYNWMDKEEEIRKQASTSKHAKRLSGGGRSVKHEHLDKELAKWVRRNRCAKKKVSRRMIQRQAKKEFEHFDQEFRASEGWLQKFMKRHNFASRRGTTVCQKPPLEYSSKIVQFIKYVAKIREEHEYDHIYACDETAVWLDASGGKTVEERGVKEVPILTTGHDKARITVMLTARSDGKKLKPMVLLPRVRPDKNIVKQFGQQLFLVWAGKIWMDDSRTAEFLNRVMGQPMFEKRLLVWDAFRCHTSEATKKVLRDLDIHTAVIPGGCTKFIQVPDVCWNAPFKAHIRSYYETWISNGDRMTFTTGGNPRAPSMEVYLDWIVRAWETLSKNMIINSFKVCGLTNASDGSEDDFIHCFKAHGPIPEGLEMLKEERAKENAPEQSEEEDMEEDFANGYLSAEDEVIENGDLF